MNRHDPPPHDSQRPNAPRKIAGREANGTGPAPGCPTRLEVGVLSGMFVGGCALLYSGLQNTCVYKGIGGGMLVGGSLVLLMIAAHTQPGDGQPWALRLPAAPRQRRKRDRANPID